MIGHPFSNVAIAAVHNTRCARRLEGFDSLSLSCKAAVDVIDKSGLKRASIDGVAGPLADSLVYNLGLGPVWTGGGVGIGLVAQAATAIATGQATTVLVVDAAAGVYTERGGTAPWTRPANEFVVGTGLFTTAEFALVARRHMHLYGTTSEQMATVAAVIRNNGNINPEAVYYDRGPTTVDQVLESRMIADPYHLLDCCITSEGGCAMILTTADRAKDLPGTSAYIHGVGLDRLGPSYQHPPAWDLGSTVDSSAATLGGLGKNAARRAFAMSGLSPADVDVCEFYDNFSFEIIRQYEAFGFCPEGEGGAFVMDGNIEPGGRYPVSTDGGLMSFNHSGSAQQLQRVVRAVQQVQGACLTNQVPDVEIAMCSGSGSAALAMNVMIVGREAP